MWCLVKLPNSVILEVRVDPKAIGQECLEKVRITFSYIHKYFALKYNGPELG